MKQVFSLAFLALLFFVPSVFSQQVLLLKQPSISAQKLAFVYATQKPPFMELAEWHYQKAISGGVQRNFNLEKMLESENQDLGKP